MKLVADDARILAIPGSGRWLAEQAPDELLAALTELLAPYRDGGRGSTCERRPLRGDKPWLYSRRPE